MTSIVLTQESPSHGEFVIAALLVFDRRMFETVWRALSDRLISTSRQWLSMSRGTSRTQSCRLIFIAPTEAKTEIVKRL